MKRSTIALLTTGAAIAALVLYGRDAQAAIDASTGMPELPMGDIPPADDTLSVDTADNPGSSLPDNLAMNIASADTAQRLNAFLWMVRNCEHNPADVAKDLDFVTFYGGARFTNLTDHPVLTGEMRGVPLDSLGPSYAGKVSTAAGALQINVPTWAGARRPDGSYSGGVRDAGSWGPRLNDFSETSQLEAGRRILILARALDAVQSGDIDTAIARASSRWASLPKAGIIGQRQHSMEYALTRFNEGLSLA